jgi:hypothetical protein
MVGGGDVLSNAQLLAQFSSEFGGESWISVANNFSGESKAYEYMFEVESGGLLRGDLFYA